MTLPGGPDAGVRGALLVALILAGCRGPVPVDDPIGALQQPGLSPRKHEGAMVALDGQPRDESYLEVLHGMMWRPGYHTDSREAAFRRLVEHDEAALKVTLNNQLPRMSAREWQERLCYHIVERDWVELSPSLVSAWSRKIGFVDDFDRVEYKALVELHGEDRVIDVVFDLLVATDRPLLRTRCWELLDRLGQRERLIALLNEQAVDPEDLMLADLRAAAVELGVVPRTQEEILWIRKLREPERSELWSQAAAVVQGLSEARRAELELRDLPILVAASIHDPWLLDAGKDELYERVAAHVTASRQHVDPRRFEGFPGTYAQRLYEHRQSLTWGDLAAMLLAIRATQVPEVVDHLLDYAERDRGDKSCEYGGIIELDQQGRFAVLEFPPRFRRRDNEFIASQEMFDAGYAGVFHFHFHVQREDNRRYAVPGKGDLDYADNTRANCLVFTSISRDTLNMDFYRHSHVIVDLGEVVRP